QLYRSSTVFFAFQTAPLSLLISVSSSYIDMQKLHIKILAIKNTRGVIPRVFNDKTQFLLLRYSFLLLHPNLQNSRKLKCILGVYFNILSSKHAPIHQYLIKEFYLPLMVNLGLVYSLLQAHHCLELTKPIQNQNEFWQLFQILL